MRARVRPAYGVAAVLLLLSIAGGTLFMRAPEQLVVGTVVGCIVLLAVVAVLRWRTR